MNLKDLQRNGNRHAVIIGINKYKDPNLLHLPGSENDAREIFDILRSPNIGNFEIPSEHFLINEKATTENIRKALNDLFLQMDYADLVLFYFSGHGFIDGFNNGFIGSYNIDEEAPFVNGIDMLEIQRLLMKSIHKCAIVIFDCCFSGVPTKGEKGSINISKFMQQYEINSQEYDSHGEGRIILSSSGDDETSCEINMPHSHDSSIHPHSLYSFYLIEGLNGLASGEDGFISLQGLHGYVETQLSGSHLQKPMQLICGGSRLDNILIALSPNIYLEFIKNNMSKANSMITNESIIDPAKLATSACCLNRILDIDEDNEEANNLKILVEDKLKLYQSEMQNWLLNNDGHLLDLPGSIKNDLWKSADNVDFQTFRGMTFESNECKIFSLLARVSLNMISLKFFLQMVNHLSNPVSSAKNIKMVS